MTKLKVEISHKKLIIFMDAQIRKKLIRGITNCLAIMRKNVVDDYITELELLEMLRIWIRGSRLKEIETAQFDKPIDMEYPCSFEISHVDAFYYSQIIQQALSYDYIDLTVPTEEKECIELLISRITEPLSACIGIEEYEKITSGKQHQINYIYIRYLDHLYEHEPYLPPLTLTEPPLAMLCSQINADNGEPEIMNLQSSYHILPFDRFHQLCTKWMRRHNTDYICLDEIIADKMFKQP